MKKGELVNKELLKEREAKRETNIGFVLLDERTRITREGRKFFLFSFMLKITLEIVCHL